MAIEINRQILLTGAGFTKNFGGFLASEMWAQIFNSYHIKPHKKLGEILRRDFDYESVCSLSKWGNFPDENIRRRPY